MEDITKACIIIQDALGTKEVIEILLKNNKCHSMSSLRYVNIRSYISLVRALLTRHHGPERGARA